MRRKVLLVVATAGLLVGSSCGLSHGGTTRAKANEAAVRATMDRFFEAAARHEWDSTAPLIAPDFVMFTDGAQTFNRDEYLKLLKADDIQIAKYELRDVTVGVSESGDLAWMTYKGRFDQTLHNKRSLVETAETILFRNEAGAWRMFRAQASVRELENK